MGGEISIIPAQNLNFPWQHRFILYLVYFFQNKATVQTLQASETLQTRSSGLTRKPANQHILSGTVDLKTRSSTRFEKVLVLTRDIARP